MATCETLNCGGVRTCPFEPLNKPCEPGLWYSPEQLAHWRATQSEPPPPPGWGADFGHKKGGPPRSRHQ